MLGKVQHVSLYTHPEISTVVSVISQQMINPSQLDLDLAFGILRYLWGTVGNNETATLCMRHSSEFDDLEFKQNPAHLLSDADLGRRRIRTGYLGYLYFNLMGWKSQKQTQVSLSTCESEDVALSA